MCAECDRKSFVLIKLDKINNVLAIKHLPRENIHMFKKQMTDKLHVFILWLNG